MNQKQQAGQKLKDWCAEAGISRQTYWRLPADRKPTAAYIGAIVRIVEPASAWLQRIAAAGPVKLQARAA